MKISSFFSSEERQSETKSFLSDEELQTRLLSILQQAIMLPG